MLTDKIKMKTYHSYRAPVVSADSTTEDDSVDETQFGNAAPLSSRLTTPTMLLDSLMYHDVDKVDMEEAREQGDVLGVKKIENNYRFGLKKWKKEVVDKQAFQEPLGVELGETFCLKLGSFLYMVFFGWWMAVVYIFVAWLMRVTIIGKRYNGTICFVAFWKNHCKGELEISQNTQDYTDTPDSSWTEEITEFMGRRKTFKWKSAGTCVWYVTGFPVLVLFHAISAALSWLFVLSIPTAKMNLRIITNVLRQDPDEIEIERSRPYKQNHLEVLMYVHQPFRVLFCRYTVDGMNVILVNLLAFTLFALAFGYAMPGKDDTMELIQFTLALLAILPLAYYIGMALISISARSNFAVGAVLNASFGSVVTVALCVAALFASNKEADHAEMICYQELTKATLTGVLMVTLLLIPGLAMTVGGLKHTTQKFNSRSAGISSALLLVSLAGTFAPTIYAKVFTSLDCSPCFGGGNSSNVSPTFCASCQSQMSKMDLQFTSPEFYSQNIKPLVYSCTVILPLAYVVALVFTLHTHTAHVFEQFIESARAISKETAASIAHWNLVKSVMILLVSTVLMALCADVVADNLGPIMRKLPPAFVGATFLAIIPQLPEIINGMAFAYNNNIAMSIELGTCIAVQVCLIQIPAIVAVDAIRPVGFELIFGDIHLWSVISTVLLINILFQSGKSDSFQGASLLIFYVIMLCFYYLGPNPGGIHC
ncbi:putative cation exchanger C521.04c [Lingula anatina]|uniref:Cation exchanger C521.04c n=1 Tax=Lingula anatina TaxID=7574 RepID=A0A1S3K8Q2_LINAN|nr:putative cation exchanger C521.04c [Lingula anatina]|eukprot:XP_013419015.1 putative cation exchanger C521.04c [Lingula anatina]